MLNKVHIKVIATYVNQTGFFHKLFTFPQENKYFTYCISTYLYEIFLLVKISIISAYVKKVKMCRDLDDRKKMEYMEHFLLKLKPVLILMFIAGIDRSTAVH